jgi:hypothetical protein
MAQICPYDGLPCEQCRFYRKEDDINSHWYRKYVCYFGAALKEAKNKILQKNK